ncbi:hypothetical protein IA539_08895 [Gordonia sp. zg691]|uniref:hypothetical protein n=1 Tax=Gordonia jinghuaiqii TaxID=2758710 RepID=UPI0016622028|nr:hypothetical protein [Gordonia jinghuaiqii]MBD0861329.1 hypothetical protein [Gordonia jinghuaiqii]
MLQGILESSRTFAGAGRGIPVQGQHVLVTFASDPINLIAEADPPIRGTRLASRLGDVITAAAALEVGANFTDRASALLNAVEEALPELREVAEDEVESVDDIISELERAFMVSLVLSMAKHHPMTVRVSEWEQRHQNFLQQRTPVDIGHYFSLRSVAPADDEDALPSSSDFYATGPGPGRVHMQHFISAIDSGANILIAGAGLKSTDAYPEAAAIQYAQWFTYIHAIWDEQFRDRFARFHSRGLPPDEALSKSDIAIDFFGDIRLIRNDFVHHYGEANNSTDLKSIPWKFTAGEPLNISMEQMVDLIDLFPREELAKMPTRKKRTRGNLPGSVDTELLQQLKLRRESLKGSKANDINDEMVADWLTKTRPDAAPETPEDGG